MAQFGSFLANHWVLASVLVLIVILLIVTELKRGVLGFADIKPQEAVRLINREDAVTLDVRDEKDYRAGHVLHAVHIPMALHAERMHELDDHNDTTEKVKCRTGQRS